MRVPKPNPEVYRRAAEMIDSGSEEFSCYAIEMASWDLGLPPEADSMYKAQYEAMFGNLLDPFIGESCNSSFVAFGRWGGSGHPYWNKNRTPSRQQMRVLALLFMAEIVENP